MYAHAPGRHFEVARQRSYAAFIAQGLPKPASIFEAGLGNGSLLLALDMLWPGSAKSGIDPAPRAVRFAREAGIDATIGILGGETDVCQARPPSEFALAVNVIEHTEDPRAFVRALIANATERIAIVCPDGTVPGTELLFADHLWSFVPNHVRTLIEDNGWVVETQRRAPSSIGHFFITTAVPRMRGRIEPDTPRLDTTPRADPAPYLARWAAVEAHLLERLQQDGIVVFGAGEATGLIRAYMPALWARVSSCVVDSVEDDRFFERPIRAYADATPQRLLLGVQPAAQRLVAKRLEGDGHTPVAWDDLLLGNA